VNKKDKARVLRLHRLIAAVPFAKIGGGTTSQSVMGLAEYDQDMRAFIPAVCIVLYGILGEGNEGWSVGYDYDDPDLVMDAIEQWRDKRKREQWQGAREWSLLPFLDAARAKMYEQEGD